MKLSRICIKRPVFAAVLAIVLILFGVIGYFKLSVQELPSIDFPIVTIQTALTGASPQIVDETVTDPIEAEMNSIQGVKHIKSQSFDGFSSIVVHFEQSTNLERAVQDVRDRIARMRRTLPNDINEPLIEKLDLNAMPVMWLAVRGTDIGSTELTDLAEHTIRERLQKVPGVGSVMLAGHKKYALRVWLDPTLLYANGLTAADVEHALKENNIELPSGRIEGINREFSVKTDGELKSIEAFEELILAYRGSSPIRMRDVGQVTEGVEDERSLARYTSEDAVGLGVIKQASANTIDVANGVKKELDKIQNLLPSTVQVEVAFDSADYIQQSVDEVKETLWSASILVVISIFIFLRNFRSTLIPALAIPISIVATFSAMHFLGFTLNNFTLLALVLSIGVVVDDAIVMLENIFRHMEQGKTAYQAALKGSKEMALPIISASLALMTVFIPIAFMEGMVGQFFFEFGVTVSIAVAVSAFVSLTLTPMLSSKMLKSTHSQSRFFERFYQGLENRYKSTLHVLLKRKYWVVVGAFALVLGSALLIGVIGKEFVTDEDRGSFMVLLQAPEGSTLEYTDLYLQQVEEKLHAHPGVEGYFSALALSQSGAPAVNKGMIFVRLTEASLRAHMTEIITELRAEMREIVGADASLITMNPFAQGAQAKMFEYVLTNSDYGELKEHVFSFVNALKKTPGFTDVSSDFEDNNALMTLHVDRDKLSDLGVSIPAISDTLNVLLAGREATKFQKKGERYGVIVQMAREFRLTPEHLSSLYVRSDRGDLVRLDQVVTMEQSIGPSTINRYDRRKAVTIAANLEGVTLQEAIQSAALLVNEQLPSTFTPVLSGQAEEMIKTFSSMLFTFAFALIITYLVLAAQFESFLYPLIILFALPLSLVGALGFLYLFGMTLNIYSLIGMIMLMGLVTKNAILLVDCANQLRKEHLSALEAICEAGRVRLRPILMTALSTILGILPIALGLGAGAESRKPLGVCVIGGMFSSTVLTLLIIPAFYLIADALKTKLIRRKVRLETYVSPESEVIAPR
ncbi:MAG: Multidrug resistance protein MdtB [Chlamydiales bacterium]|nr:Multidrug resistance protein MdtB [Chlamydiales bacterium]